jgi:hypothetical protein
LTVHLAAVGGDDKSQRFLDPGVLLESGAEVGGKQPKLRATDPGGDHPAAAARPILSPRSVRAHASAETIVPLRSAKKSLTLKFGRAHANAQSKIRAPQCDT